MMYKDPIGAHRNAGIPMTGETWSEKHYTGEDLAGVIFQDCVFENVRLEKTNLEQTLFLNCRLENCVFTDCRIIRGAFVGCTGAGLRISGGEFTDTAITQAKIDGLTLAAVGERIVLSECKIGRLSFEGKGCRQDVVTLSDCEFREFLAENAEWKSASLVGVDLSVCTLTGARFENCSFIRTAGEGVDLSRVRFTSCNFYQAKLPAARIRHAEKTIFADCDLTEADFTEAEIEGAMFAKSDATGACFERARLARSLFPNAILVRARFAGALARESIWTEADLTEADLAGVDAYRGIFRNALLTDAKVEGASFVEADLHGVEAPLDGADLRDSRGSVEWRAELEAEARKPPEES